MYAYLQYNWLKPKVLVVFFSYISLRHLTGGFPVCSCWVRVTEREKEKKTKALIWKHNYIPGKACHQNNNEIYIVECLIEHEKSSLFRPQHTQKKTTYASPARAKQLHELTGVLFACHKDLTLQSGDLTRGDTCTVPVTMTTRPVLSFTKTPARLSLWSVCAHVIPDHPVLL